MENRLTENFNSLQIIIRKYEIFTIQKKQVKKLKLLNPKAPFLKLIKKYVK